MNIFFIILINNVGFFEISGLREIADTENSDENALGWRCSLLDDFLLLSCRIFNLHVDFFCDIWCTYW